MGQTALYPIDFSCKDIFNFKDKNSYQYSFCVASSCNIWFEEIEDKNFKKTDSKILAYKNTPRFNSFWRELVKVCENYGGRVQIEDSNNPYRKWLTKDGILLDGKILYQEDVDK